MYLQALRIKRDFELQMKFDRLKRNIEHKIDLQMNFDQLKRDIEKKFDLSLQKIEQKKKPLIRAKNEIHTLKTNENSTKKHSLIIVLGDFGVGDYMMFRVFLPFIKEHYKDYKITLLGSIRYKEVFLEFDQELVDEFIYYEVKEPQFLHLDIKDYFSVRYYDIFLSCYYARAIADGYCSLIQAFKKISTAGGLLFMGQRQRAKLKQYDKVIYPSEKDMFELYRNQEFFEQLFERKIDIKDISLPLDKDKFSKIDFDFTQNYAVVFFGATDENRMWDIYNYQAVCEHLYQKYNIISFLIGSAKEQDLARNITNDKYIFSLCGKYSLDEIFYLINKSKIVLCNDSGGYHMAMCVSDNIIVISGGGVYTRFVNYPQEFKKGKIISTPLPKDVFNNPYAEYDFNKRLLNSISAEEICELIDAKHLNQKEFTDHAS